MNKSAPTFIYQVELWKLSKKHNSRKRKGVIALEKVSIITPTFNRPHFLNLCHQCVLSQLYPNAEWLICDDSDRRNEQFSKTKFDNIYYWHSPERLSIGEKRNFLIEKASGDIIVNFDDDDYYSPNYITEIVRELEGQKSDLINLRSFFVFSTICNQYGYWNLMIREGLHYRMSPTGTQLILANRQNNAGFANNHLGYGFGWAFKRHVWLTAQYPKINWQEDSEFALRAIKNGYAFSGMMDDKGICLHNIHRHNTTMCFPQFILPNRIMNKFFDIEFINQYVTT